MAVYQAAVAVSTVVAPLVAAVTHKVVVHPAATVMVTQHLIAMAKLAVSIVLQEERTGRQMNGSSSMMIVTGSLVSALATEVGSVPPHKHRKYAKHMETDTVPLDLLDKEARADSARLTATITQETRVSSTTGTVLGLIAIVIVTDRGTAQPSEPRTCVHQREGIVGSAASRDTTGNRTHDSSSIRTASGTTATATVMGRITAPQREREKSPDAEVIVPVKELSPVRTAW